jgi:hypothetical protein
VTGAGSSAIGKFTLNLTVATPPTWNNRDQAALVPRSKDLTLSWTGGAQSLIFGISQDVPENATGAFLCVAPSGSSSFTVPAYVLSALPGTRSILSNSRGYIEIHSLSGTPVSFQATSLTSGMGIADSVNRRSVAFQ